MAFRPWVYFAVGGALCAATIGAAGLGVGYMAGLPGVAGIFLVAGMVALSSPNRPSGRRKRASPGDPADTRLEEQSMKELTPMSLRIRRYRFWSWVAFGLAAVMVLAMLGLGFSAVHIDPYYQAIAVTFPLMVGFFLRQQATSLLDLQQREDNPPE